MQIIVTGELIADAEYRMTGPTGAGGVLFLKFRANTLVELRSRIDDAIEGNRVARLLRRGAVVKASGESVWPRTDHAELAVIVGGVKSIAVDGRQIL